MLQPNWAFSSHLDTQARAQAEEPSDRSGTAHVRSSTSFLQVRHEDVFEHSGQDPGIAWISPHASTFSPPPAASAPTQHLHERHGDLS